MIFFMPLLPVFPFFYLVHLVSPGSERTDQQSVFRRETREEDPELNHGLQTDGTDLPVPQRRREVRCHQD